MPNHTSDQHPWFLAALAAGPGSPARERYLIRHLADLAASTRSSTAKPIVCLAGLAPEQILAAPDAVLLGVVAGIRPAERVARLRRCAELAIAGAPWRAFPGIGLPGTERIELYWTVRAPARHRRCTESIKPWPAAGPNPCPSAVHT